MNNEKKIKVLFRHRSMEMGGVEKVLLSIIKNLDRKIFDITVCLNLNQGELRDEFPADVKKVFLAKGREDMSSNPIVQKLQLVNRTLKLRKLLKNPKYIDTKILNEKYDIEVAMTYNDFSMVLNSSNKKSKKVGWFHSEIHIPKMQPLVPNILKHFPQFDIMVYCSKRIKNLMHEHYPNLKYPTEKVIVNAIPIEEIKEKANQGSPNLPKGPIFFSMARLHSRKGFHKLVDAHAQLIKEGYQHSILILGEGEEEENLRKQIAHYGLEKTFIIQPFEMNPYPYVKNCDYYILPSESEAWPLAIAEALILQKPIIATNVGDIGEMIHDRQTGHLINYDTQEIYEAIKIFLTDKDYVNQIKNNLLTIENQFNNEKIFNEIQNTFLNLLDLK